MRRPRYWKWGGYVAGNGRILGVVLPITRPTAFGDVVWCHYRTATTGRERTSEAAKAIVEKLCNTNTNTKS